MAKQKLLDSKKFNNKNLKHVTHQTLLLSKEKVINLQILLTQLEVELDQLFEIHGLEEEVEEDEPPADSINE